ncbi:MAG: Spo0J and IME4 domain-containing protein, partial [Rhodosalinus sp.]
MQNVTKIAVADLHPHPSNPRLAMREDVVAAIAANLTDGFDPAHALIVRPVGDGYQILSGHHRHEAAKQVGLDVVPCWVREMDDEAAYMALVTSNSQGELSPLEIGMHALHCVGLSKGGRGQKGGLSAYAEKVGRERTNISRLVQAAEVAEKVCVDSHVLQDKTQHLAAIRALPAACWQEAVEAMLAKGWSAKDTAERVKAAQSSTAKRTVALFTGKTTQRELARIDEIAQRTSDSLQDDGLKAEWLEWVESADPVDVKEIQAKRIEFEDRDADLREDPPAEKPQLVLADPPWRYDFAQTDSRQIENQYPSAELDEIIAHSPDTEDDCVLLLWATATKLPEALEV